MRVMPSKRLFQEIDQQGTLQVNQRNVPTNDVSIQFTNDDSREETKLLPIVPIESMFGVLESAHLTLNHFGRDKMHEHLRRQYANITEEVVKIFLKFCRIVKRRGIDRSAKVMFTVQ